MLWQLLRSPYEMPKLVLDDQSEPVWPSVCIQLPMFNEASVAHRLISACGRLEYPGFLEIQVLDDSTDHTVEVVDAAVQELQARGVAITVVRRVQRVDFKAGALREGMLGSQAELFCIFDADFLPGTDFLIRTVPHLVCDEKLAYVQARWGHINRNQNFLTKAQAVLIDGHFMIEHAARYNSAFFNFNGTAGVWRRQAIEEAGGWQGDTVTEDLDLSYRALLQGWRACYLRDVVCMAELPATISAFKGQQYRWMKGAAQVCRKLLPRILVSALPWRFKREAFFHLSAHVCYPMMVIAALCMVPAAWLRVALFHSPGLWIESTVFVVTFGSMLSFYIASQRLQRNGYRSLAPVIGAMLLGVGISWHCAIAVCSGWTKRGGEFVRTPKLGWVSRSQKAIDPLTQGDGASAHFVRVKEVSIRGVSLFEFFLFVYLVAAVCGAVWGGMLLTVPFAAFFAAGYSAVVLSGIAIKRAAIRRVSERSVAH